MSALYERVKAAMEYKGCNEAQLAAAAKVQPPTVYGWLGRQKKQDTIRAAPCLRAAEFMGVDPWWLATGEGEMIPTAGLPTPPAYRDFVSKLPHVPEVVLKGWITLADQAYEEAIQQRKRRK